MNSKKYQPPSLNRKLLRDAGLAPAIPMAVTVAEAFSPLDRARIMEKVGYTAAGPDNSSRKSVLPEGSGYLAGHKHFQLAIDQELLNNHAAIRINNCANFSIHTSGSGITPADRGKFLIEITNCKHFTIEGLNCSGGRNMMLVANSSSFTLRDCAYAQGAGVGIAIHDCDGFTVKDCRFTDNLSAGIIITGHTRNGEITGCSCTGSTGMFNKDAGIHLCHTGPETTTDLIPDRCHDPLPITDKTKRPHHIVIRDCTLARCRAQGIYLEGAVNCLIENNLLLDNNKEGICFDWGSCCNIFSGNTVTLNGERRNLSRAEIKADYITEYPMLEDGSSSMKLPGISLDNGCLNLLRDNRIIGNYGGGIKMIRTALFNWIEGNQLSHNTIGTNRFSPHFHGITILGLGCVNQEFHAERALLLDFTPSILNTITGNVIRESAPAVYMDRLCANNMLERNTIMTGGNSRVQNFLNRAQAFLRRHVVKRFSDN